MWTETFVGNITFHACTGMQSKSASTGLQETLAVLCFLVMGAIRVCAKFLISLCEMCEISITIGAHRSDPESPAKYAVGQMSSVLVMELTEIVLWSYWKFPWTTRSAAESNPSILLYSILAEDMLNKTQKKRKTCLNMRSFNQLDLPKFIQGEKRLIN